MRKKNPNNDNGGYPGPDSPPPVVLRRGDLVVRNPATGEATVTHPARTLRRAGRLLAQRAGERLDAIAQTSTAAERAVDATRAITGAAREVAGDPRIGRVARAAGRGAFEGFAQKTGHEISVNGTESTTHPLQAAKFAGHASLHPVSAVTKAASGAAQGLVSGAVSEIQVIRQEAAATGAQGLPPSGRATPEGGVPGQIGGDGAGQQYPGPQQQPPHLPGPR